MSRIGISLSGDVIERSVKCALIGRNFKSRYFMSRANFKKGNNALSSTARAEMSALNQQGQLAFITLRPFKPMIFLISMSE